MANAPMQYCGVNHVALVARDMAEHVSNWAFGHFLKPLGKGK